MSAPPTRSGIRHGVDLVDVDHLRDVMARHPQMEARVFTDAESAYCRRYPDPLPHFAARFAAKEATLKALGLGITPTGIDAMFASIEVDRRGREPQLRLTGRAARRAEHLGIASSAVSLSHTRAQALASVVFLTEEGTP